MIVVALSGLVVVVVVVIGVPAVAVTAVTIAAVAVLAVVLLLFFINPLGECSRCCCCWRLLSVLSRRRYLLHKGGTFAAEVESVAGFAIGADEPEAAITGIECLRALAALVVIGVK